MGKRPWFSLYCADILMDEKVRCMDNRAFGIYVKLLCHAWLEGSIPDDIARVSLMVGERLDVLQEAWADIRPCLFRKSKGRLSQKRLESERKIAEVLSAERTQSGRRGANIRWGKDLENGKAIGKANSSANVLPMAKDSYSQSQSQSQSQKEKKPPISPKGNSLYECKHFQIFWSAYPKRKGKKRAWRAWLKITNPAETIKAILEALAWQSSEKEWVKENRLYMPMPEQYLNGQRWEDEKQKSSLDEWEAEGE